MNERIAVRSEQRWTAANVLDEHGRPAGGSAVGIGVAISWQTGPLVVDGVRREPTGAFVEDVLEICAERIAFYQSTQSACDENAAALENIRSALAHLHARTARRTQAGTEGTHEGN